MCHSSLDNVNEYHSVVNSHDSTKLKVLSDSATCILNKNVLNFAMYILNIPFYKYQALSTAQQPCVLTKKKKL